MNSHCPRSDTACTGGKKKHKICSFGHPTTDGKGIGCCTKREQTCYSQTDASNSGDCARYADGDEYKCNEDSLNLGCVWGDDNKWECTVDSVTHASDDCNKACKKANKKYVSDPLSCDFDKPECWEMPS